MTGVPFALLRQPATETPPDTGELRQARLGLPNLQRIADKYPNDRSSNIEAHVRGSSMSKRVSYGPACVGLFVGAITLGANSATLAADDCLTAPNRAPAPGGHWYFHGDRATNRKCWYLVEPDARSPTADASQLQPSTEAPPQPGFGSFFSLMGLPGTPVGPQPDTASSAGRAGDVARPDDPRSAAAPSPRPASARHPDAQAALTPKPRRPSPARPPTEHADDQAASPPDQAERDALFQEFLRWRDHRTP
jgi:hypothetical protein